MDASRRSKMAELAGLEEGTPEQLKHCVASVAAKSGHCTRRAFAICTASLQKAGQLKKGTQDLTKKGEKVAASKAAEPEAASKRDDYEAELAAARKEESMDATAKHDETKCQHCHDASTLTPEAYRNKHKILGDFHALRQKHRKEVGSFEAAVVAKHPPVHKEMSDKHGKDWFEDWKKARVHQPLVGESVDAQWRFIDPEDSQKLEAMESIGAIAGVATELDEDLAELEDDVDALGFFVEWLEDLEEAARLTPRASHSLHRKEAVKSMRLARLAVAPETPGSRESKMGRKQRLHDIAAFHLQHAADAYERSGRDKRAKWLRALAKRHSPQSGEYYADRRTGEWRHTRDHGKDHPGKTAAQPAAVAAHSRIHKMAEEYRRMSGIVDMTEDWKPSEK